MLCIHKSINFTLDKLIIWYKKFSRKCTAILGGTCVKTWGQVRSPLASRLASDQSTHHHMPIHTAQVKMDIRRPDDTKNLQLWRRMSSEYTLRFDFWESPLYDPVLVETGEIVQNQSKVRCAASQPPTSWSPVARLLVAAKGFNNLWNSMELNAFHY